MLELIATEPPQLLDFQLDTLLNSPSRFVVRKLASIFAVPLDQVGRLAQKACLDLNRLEKRRGVWKDPSRVLQSPNVSALLQFCQARGVRVAGTARRRKLEAIERRLRAADDLARSRAWIEAFIGPPVLEKR